MVDLFGPERAARGPACVIGGSSQATASRIVTLSRIVTSRASSRLASEGPDQRDGDEDRSRQAEHKCRRLGPLHTAARGSIR